MKTADLVARLDSFFRVGEYPAEDFAEIEEFCREAVIPLADYATPGFMKRHNGLMLDNAPDVAWVFTLVFPSDEVLAEVERLAAGRPGLIFTHHPMDFETSGRGLLPVGEEWLKRLREAGISLYSAHAPLDCHEAVSTSRALAREVGVAVESVFAGYHGGHEGVIGTTGPQEFDEFVSRVGVACGVGRVNTRPYSDRVHRVAVVAGGAAFPAMMREAQAARCDTYLTGDFRVRHGGPWAEEHRPQFDAEIERLTINLVGGSHAGSEGVVLRHDMIDWFLEAGVGAEFVAQDDLWR